MKEEYFAEQTIKAIKYAVGSDSIGLHEPTFNGNEWLYLKECLDSSYVSSVGKFVDRFEQELAEFTGANFAICVVNGTSALQIALKLAGVEADDEVLAPALTFIATANAISYCGATPNFVDSTAENLGIDTDKLREYLNKNSVMKSGLCINKLTKRVIRAIVPMHTFGHPSNMSGLLQISNDFNLVLVEDAAESLGSYYRNQHTGTFGLVGALSFNGNKIITTGGGGAILTNNEVLAKRAKHITRTAKVVHAWEFDHDEIGYNFRMPNINAALGCAQIEQLNNKIRLKRTLFQKYKEAFSTVTFASLYEEPKDCQSNYWLQTILLDKDSAPFRDKILKETNNAGLMTRPAWKLISDLNPYKTAPRMDLSEATSLSKRIINLPSNPSTLSEKNE